MFENNIEYLAREIVNIAYKIQFSLGPGLLESVYEVCFCYELEKRNIAFVSQKKVPIYYDGIEYREGLRVDILVDNKIIIELKAQEVLPSRLGSSIVKLFKIIKYAHWIYYQFQCAINKTRNKKNGIITFKIKNVFS